MSEEQNTESLLAQSAAQHNVSSRWWWLSGVVVVLAALAYGFFFGSSLDSEQAVLEKVLVTKGDVVLEVSAVGRVTTLEDLELFFSEQGLLKNLSVTEGDVVKAGDVLARQDTRDALLEIQQAELSLQTARDAAQSGNAAVSVTAGAADVDLQQAQRELDSLRSEHEVELTAVYTEALVSLSQAADTFSQALHTVDISFAIDAKTTGDFTRGSFSSHRVDTVERYEVATEAYDSYLEHLNTQKVVIDRPALESVIAEGVELGKLVNQTVQSGLTTLDTTDPSSYISQETINRLVNDLQPEQVKVKAEVADLTALSSSFATVNTRQTNEINSQEALIRSLEVKVAAAQQGVGSAAAQVAQAELNLRSSQNHYEDLLLRAPISGTVGPINYRVGEYVGSDRVTPVLSVLGGQGVSIEAFVEEVDVAKIEPGMDVVVEFDAFSDEFFDGVVTFISGSPTVDANGIVTYRMVVTVETEDDRVREGMTAYVDVIASGVRDVLVIPVAAVQPINGSPSVQLIDGAWVPVVAGFTDGKQVEVKEGLSKGDTVVYEK